MRDDYRRRTEDAEQQVLSPRARLSSKSRGRDVAEDEDPIRTCFQRDRDRIIHCKAFRRLAHKTQVFIAPEGDHYRVRLTHTLEVTQVARTIARALRLNEDLVEAICLGHDVGHTPFGHLGEEVVARFKPGFRHNLQSVRVVDVLERLNLTWEVRDGIANHTWTMAMPATLEGQIARYADRIAYLNHDIDDAVRAGILSDSDLPEDTVLVLGSAHSDRIRSMVTDLVKESWDSDSIRMSDGVFAAMAATRDFLFEHVYIGQVAPATRDMVDVVLTTLLEHHAGDRHGGRSETTSEAAVDYVAGMTDRFALRAFEALAGTPAPSLGVLG